MNIYTAKKWHFRWNKRDVWRWKS